MGYKIGMREHKSITRIFRAQIKREPSEYYAGGGTKDVSGQRLKVGRKYSTEETTLHHDKKKEEKDERS